MQTPKATLHIQYTVVLRGKEDGAEKVETRVITSIADAVDCIEEYEKYAAYAETLVFQYQDLLILWENFQKMQ